MKSRNFHQDFVKKCFCYFKESHTLTDHYILFSHWSNSLHGCSMGLREK